MSPPTYQLIVRQVFAADRERVFRAWSEPGEMRKWFSPVGFTTPLVEADVRPGGRYRIGMQSPEGAAVFANGIYREVSPPERLVFTWSWEQGEGPHTGETLVTVEFRNAGSGTEVVLTHELLPSDEAVERHREGWLACIASLSANLGEPSNPGG